MSKLVGKVVCRVVSRAVCKVASRVVSRVGCRVVSVFECLFERHSVLLAGRGFTYWSPAAVKVEGRRRGPNISESCS